MKNQRSTFPINRGLSKLTSGGLALLLILTSLSLAAPSQAAAAASDRVNSSYSVTFTATDQNPWGPGNVAPNGNIITLFGEQWDEKGEKSAIVKDPLFGTKNGVAIRGATKGNISLDARAKGFTDGKVSVNYPVDVTLTWPAANSFKVGQTISIGSTYKVKPEASMSVNAGTGDLDVLVNFGLWADSVVSLCVAGCKEIPFDIPKSFPKLTNEKLFSMGQMISLCSIANLEKVKVAGCDVDYAFVNGHVGMPNMKFTSTVEADGKTLQAKASHPNFADFSLDLNSAIETISPIGLGIAIPKSIKGVSGEITLATMGAHLQLSQDQTVRFSPVVQGIILLPATAPEVAYTEKDPTGKVVSRGVSRQIIWDVGNMVDVVVPATLNSGDLLKANPVFRLKPGTNFSNEAVTTVVTDLSISALLAGAGASIPGIGSKEVTLGPLWEKHFAKRKEPNTKLFDRNQAPWALSGVATKVAAGSKEVVLDPQFAPSIALAAPTLQGNKLSTTFAVSDVEKDPLTWKMEWDDGKVDTGKTDGSDKTVQADHTYAKDGSHTGKLTVDDGHSQVVLVADAGKDTWAIMGGDLLETRTMNLTAGFADPKHVAIKSATIDWGDGTKPTDGVVSKTPFGPAGNGAMPNGSVSASHAYAAKGAYTATVSLTDEKGATTKRSVAVTIANLPPAVSAEPENNKLGKVWQCADCEAELFSGETATLKASFTDPSASDTHTATVDWGDGSPIESVKLYEVNGSGNLTATHRYVGHDVKTAKVCIADSSGGTGCDDVKIRIWDRHVGVNVMPGSLENRIDPNKPVTVAVLTTYDHTYGLAQRFDATKIKYIHFGANGKWTDPADMKGKAESVLELDEKTQDKDNDLLFQFDPKAIGLNEKSTEFNVQGYTEDGVWFWETVKVNLPAATIGANKAPVVKVEPEINRLGKVGGCPTCVTELDSGQTTNLKVSFTDANRTDIHKATVDWGDGSPIESLNLSEKDGSGSLTASHRYVKPGVNKATFCISDQLGGKGCQSVDIRPWDRHVGVNFMPGSKDNKIDPTKPVTVAILTTQANEYNTDRSVEPFDATQIEYIHLNAKGGKWADPLDMKGVAQDALELDQVTRDGDTDMVYQFDPKAVGLTASTTEVYVQGMTHDGVWFWATIPVNVKAANKAPVVKAEPEYNRLGKVGGCTDCKTELYSGETTTVKASFTDTDYTFRATVDWGDGTPFETVPVSLGGDKVAGTVTASHRYVGNGIKTMKVCVTDDQGGTGCDQYKVRIWDRHAATNVMPGTTDSTIRLSQSVTIAILSTQGGEQDTVGSFDATQIKYLHVRAKDGNWVEGTNGKLQDSLEPDQKTRDGDYDMLFEFDPKALGLTEQTTEMNVQGYTNDGVWFWATVMVHVVK